MIKNKITKTISDYIDFLNEGGTNCVFIMSRAGMGKSYVVESSLKAKEIDYVVHSGYMTAKNVYEIMYKNNGKTILLDDMGGIFTNKSVSFLKPALFSNSVNRKISYFSTKSELNGLPSEFDFTGKLIILTNTLPNQENEDVKALLSRTTHLTVDYSKSELEELSLKIIESRVGSNLKKNVIIELINCSKLNKEEFNLRKLDQMIRLIEFNVIKAPRMYENLLEVN